MRGAKIFLGFKFNFSVIFLFGIVTFIGNTFALSSVNSLLKKIIFSFLLKCKFVLSSPSIKIILLFECKDSSKNIFERVTIHI